MIVSQEARLRCIRLRAEAGLPPTIEDPVTLGQLQDLHRSCTRRSSSGAREPRPGTTTTFSSAYRSTD